MDYDKDGVWKKDGSTTANDGHSLITKHITVKLMRLAKQGPSEKTVTRTVHFVTNTENNPALNPVVEQKVSFHTDDAYWIDEATGKQIDSTNVKQVTGADGQTYNVVNDVNAPEKTVNWTTDNDTFVGVKRPEITKNSGELKGTWKIIKSTKDTVDGTEYTGQDAQTAPAEKKVAKEVKDGSHEEVFLIYGQQVGYNVHYRDVTNLVAGGKTTDFTKDDGDDLGHKVTNIDGIVGETPDKTADLWQNYGDEGYVLVSNPSGDQLGKQTLTKGVKDQYVYLMRTATKQTDQKTAERTIHYVGVVHNDDDVKTANELQPSITQKVTLVGTYYTDHSGEQVNIKSVKIGNTTYNVVVQPSTEQPAKETWVIDGEHSGVSEKNGKYDFAKAEGTAAPAQINVNTNWSTAHNNVATGDWGHVVILDQNNKSIAVDPTDSNWKNQLDDVYLVYKQKGNYNIHYVDVTGKVVAGKTSGFTKDDGQDLGHEVTDIHGYVTDQPDATKNLWQNYADEGYVLVENPSGDQLGKQTIAKDTPDQYVYLMKVATKQTEQKNAERTIHYVGVVHDKDDVTKAQKLQEPTMQNVTLTGTYYVDHDGTRVNTKQVKIGNQTYDVVDDSQPATETWTIDSQTGVTENNSKYDFAEVATPDKIGEGKDQWTHKSDLDQDNGKVIVDPNSEEWPKDNKLTDGYVVYKQHAKYNIHYIDVNGVEDKTTYDPTDGHELTDHKVENVGNGKDLTTTPVATGLWSKEDYEKAGYVLVGLSDNAKNDKLGKQTITIGVQDQYVYLKHAVKTITHKTPTTDVPKDKDGKPAVDPKDLHKEFNRNIYYKAITADGKTLKDVTKQHTEFDGSIDVDVVTGKTTTAETIKVDGKDVKVATTTPGKISWDKQADTFDKITQPTITLKNGDKHAEPDTIGTWYQVSGKADEVKVTPSDTKNPSDETLVYKQKGNYNIHYVDVTGKVIAGKTSGFTKNDGNDLGHTITDIGGYIGDSTDKTADLWTKYGDEGYVLVENPSGDQLGKQTIAKDTPDQYVYLMRVATPKTEQKTATRTIHYVGINNEYDDITKGEKLQGDTHQSVTLTGTSYVDHAGKLVHVKQVKIGGQTYDVIDDSKPAKETWEITSQTGVTANNGKYDLAEVNKPDSIGEWQHKPNLDRDNGLVSVDPNNDWKETLTDGYLVYMKSQKPEQDTKYSVTVHYVDEDGNVIKDPVLDGTDYKDGSDYSTTDHKPTEITTIDGKTYIFEKIDPKDSNETGKIPGKNIDVTYVYKLDANKTKIYNTTVKYVDEHGHELIPSVPGQQKLHTGDRFDNSNKKKDTITTSDGTKYVLVPEKSTNVSGQIADHDEVTVYVYKPVVPSGGSVIPGGDQPGTPEKPDQTEQPEQPAEPTTPQEPNEPSTPQEDTDTPKEAPEHETKHAKRTVKHVKEADKRQVSKLHAEKTADYSNNNMPRSESVAGHGTRLVAPKNEPGRVLSETAISAQKNGQLPQTGEKHSSTLAVGASLALASAIGLLGMAFADRKKRR